MSYHTYNRAIAWVFVGLVLLIFLSMTLFAVSTAQAQTDDNETTGTVERVDRYTVIVNSSYSEQTGMATVTLESDIVQDVVISDAGAFVTGGQVERREVTLVPGDRQEVRLPVTEVEGRVGLSVATERQLYAHIMETTNYLFYSDPGWGTVRIVGFGSGIGVLVALGAEVARRKWFGRNEVMRLA